MWAGPPARLCSFQCVVSMKFLSTIKIIALCAGVAGATPVFSHISLAQGQAPAGSSYKAVFGVSHGCAGSATTGLDVYLPAGFQGARPMPKAGWTVTTRVDKLAAPYTSHGKTVTDDVMLVSWRAANREAALADAHYDEFVLRGKLPAQAGPLWFKVLQTCESGRNDWSELPATGTSTQGLKSPAVLLDVRPDGAGQHHH